MQITQIYNPANQRGELIASIVDADKIVSKYSYTSDNRRYLSDDYMSTLFKMIRANYPNTLNHRYGIQWPKWVDLADTTSSGGPIYNGISQNEPNMASNMLEKGAHIKKLGDNEGRQAFFYEYGVTTEPGQDDYNNLPLFMWWKCNYIKDEYGNMLPTALEGDEDYAETGSVDVGIIQMACYIKYLETYDNVHYTENDYAPVYEFTDGKGYPVHQVWLSLTKPANEHEWVTVDAAVRHDGSLAPYAIRVPYHSGVASDGKYRSQPGLLASQYMSYDALYQRYNVTTSSYYKGPGYHGGSTEPWAWAWLMCIMKYGCKSSQDLCTGVIGWKNIFVAEAMSAPGKTFKIAKSGLAGLKVGTRIAICTQGTAAKTDYNTSGLSSNTYNEWRTNTADAKYLKDSAGKGVASVLVTAIKNSSDGVNSEITVDAENDFQTVTSTIEAPFYQKPDGTLLGMNGSASWTDVKYKENPREGWTLDENYPIASKNAATVLEYETNGTDATYNSYHYVPDFATRECTNRCYIQQAHPTAGFSNVIPGVYDGCCGARNNTWSGYRLCGLEFGQGMWEVMSDAVYLNTDNGDGKKAYVYFAPKGKPRVRSGEANFKANYVVSPTTRLAVPLWPNEYTFTYGLSQTVHTIGDSTEPLYISSCIYPTGELTNNPGVGSGANSYGDYYWYGSAGPYEYLLGGYVNYGTYAGLLCLYSNGGLGAGGWNIAARD